jgi:spore germination cell wall hydrolase CwlJ-like protein
LAAETKDRMTRFFGAGGASAIAALFMLAVGASSDAKAQISTTSTAAFSAVPAKPAVTTSTLAPAGSVSVALPQAVPAVLTATVRPAAQPVISSAAAALPVSHLGLWPLVWANMSGAALDDEQNCIATAVYFEARGEPFDGQLAVAEVVMNRAGSGRYPGSYCAVVKQPWQFSFVRAGRFPRVDEGSAAWAYAQAIARIAKQRLADALPDDVLWYHADYVAPVWGRRLSRVEKIGAHIFYRA